MKIIHGGITRSGKVISYPLDPGDQDSSPILIAHDSLEDNFDSFAFFYHLVHQERKTGFKTKALEDFNKRMFFFQRLVRAATSMEDYKQKLGIKNEDDLLFFGKQLVFKL